MYLTIKTLTTKSLENYYYYYYVKKKDRKEEALKTKSLCEHILSCNWREEDVSTCLVMKLLGF
jgi:hypothetical protein